MDIKMTQEERRKVIMEMEILAKDIRGQILNAFTLLEFNINSLIFHYGLFEKPQLLSMKDRKEFFNK